MKSIYRCEMCGKDFYDHMECYDHESNHVKPLNYNAVAKVIHDGELDYPTALAVKMSNGSVVTYTFQEIVSVAEESEAPDA